MEIQHFELYLFGITRIFRLVRDPASAALALIPGVLDKVGHTAAKAIMGLNLEKLRYRLKNDSRFRKRFKKILLIGGLSLLLLTVLGIIAIYYLASAIIGFLFAHVPGLLELGFSYFRDFAGSFALADLTARLGPLAGGANVNELTALVTQYFNQLGSNAGIDFQSFQNFVGTVKASLLDKQVSSAELEAVRALVPAS